METQIVNNSASEVISYEQITDENRLEILDEFIRKKPPERVAFLRFYCNSVSIIASEGQVRFHLLNTAKSLPSSKTISVIPYFLAVFT